MEALFIFIAKSSGLMILFYFAYYFLLRKETFFNSNRWFLLAGLITSVVLPLIVYSKIIWVDPTPISQLNFSQDFVPQTVPQENFEINWNYVMLAVYAIGLIGFLIKFGIDFYSLNSVLKGKKVKQQADFKFVDISENIAPFSYFDYIVYNSSLYSETELESILEHEKIHSEQNHTVDVLISRAFCVLFWFNPVIWLYKKAIVQNLEFIADKEAAKNIADKRAYQYTLLKITTHENCVAITNHFYQSLIKKRIVMLNKNQSKKRNSWKFCAVIPALVAFVLLFQVETIAQEKPVITNTPAAADLESMHIYAINKNTTDTEIEERVKMLKEKHNIATTISEVERNSKNEITSIKVELKNNDESVKVKQSKSTNGIDKIGIIVLNEKDGKTTFKFADDQKAVGESKIIIHKNANKKTHVEVTSTSDKSVKTAKLDKKQKTKQLIVVDGKEYPENTSIDELEPLSIATMNVLKGDAAITKYGKKAKDGVIEITTHKNTSVAMSFTTSNSNENVNNITENKNVDYTKAVIVIDGKVSDKAELDKLDPNNIKSVSVSKVKSYPQSLKVSTVEKYGDKALENGLIIIETSFKSGN